MNDVKYEPSCMNSFIKHFVDHLLESFPNRLCIIGSTAVTIASNKILSSKYIGQFFSLAQEDGNRVTKDLDLIIDELQLQHLMKWFANYGEMERVVKNDRASYFIRTANKNKLNSRGISCVNHYRLNFRESCKDIGGKMLRDVIGDFFLEIDIIVLLNKTKNAWISITTLIKECSNSWVIHSSMRNVIVWKNKQKRLCYKQFKKPILYAAVEPNKCIGENITINWLIETLKYMKWKENRAIFNEITVNEKVTQYDVIDNKLQFVNDLVYTRKNVEYYKFPDISDIMQTKMYSIECLDKESEELTEQCCVICQEQLLNKPQINLSSFKCGCMQHTKCLVNYVLTYLYDYYEQLIEYDKLSEIEKQDHPRVYMFNDISGEKIIIGNKCPHCNIIAVTNKFGKKVVNSGVSTIDWIFPTV